MAFPENLQYLRKRAKLTQEELAEELKVSRQSVSKWETGEAYPETEKLIALCDKFGVTMDGFLRGDLTMPQPEREEAQRQAAATEEGAGDRETLKKAAVLSAVCSGVFVCSLSVFLICGFVWGLWRVCWVSFLFGFSVCSVVHAFGGDGRDGSARHRGARTKFQHISASLSGAVMFFCVGVYLILGVNYGLWHPYWLICTAGAVVCIVLGVLSGDDYRKDGDGKGE